MIIRLIILTILFTHSLCGQEVIFNPDISVQNEAVINTKTAEFSPSLFGDNLIYVRQSDTISSLTREMHFDLNLAGLNLQNEIFNSTLLSPVINTPYHEGPAYFETNTNILYYSSIDPSDTIAQSSLPPNKLMTSSFQNGEWSEPEISSLNIAHFSSLHPAISNDGVWMVFASNRPDGYGNMDLFMSIKKDEIWGDPVNLGGLINTEAAEVFPYIDENLNLYFARKSEATGLDIFLSVFYNGHYLTPVKLPPPLNSEYDDFGLCMYTPNELGYFSSNRPKGQGGDDIYRFEIENFLFKVEQLHEDLEITVRHQQSKRVLSDALINIRKLDDLELSGIDPSLFKLNPVEIFDSLRTDENGIAIIKDPLQSFLIEVIYPGMKPWHKIYIDNASRRQINILLADEDFKKPNINIEVPVEINNEDLEVGSVLTFNNIFYSYNSYIIEEGAAYELDALVEYMKLNPSVNIELISHTDARGEKEYNQFLSEKRAASARDYLQLKGIDVKRIKFSGKGEAEIRNHCLDGIQCSDEEHNFNRRTEVIILSK